MRRLSLTRSSLCRELIRVASPPSLQVFAYLSAAANAAKDTPPSPSSSPLAPLHAPPLGTDPLMLGRWANAPSSSAYGSRSSKSADSGSNHSSSTTTTTNWLSGLKLSEDDLMAWVRSHCRSSSSSKTHDSGQLANSRRCPLLRPEHEDDFFGIFVFTAVRRLLFYLDTAPRRRQVIVCFFLFLILFFFSVFDEMARTAQYNAAQYSSIHYNAVQ